MQDLIPWKTLLERGKLYPCKKLNDSCLSHNNRTLCITNKQEKSALVYYSTYWQNDPNKESLLKTKPKAAVYLKKISDSDSYCNKICDQPQTLRLRVSFWLEDLHTEFESNFDPSPTELKSNEKKTWVFEFEFKGKLDILKPENQFATLKSCQIQKPQPINQSKAQISQQQSQSPLNALNQNQIDQSSQGIIVKLKYDLKELEPPIMNSNPVLIPNQRNWKQLYFENFKQQGNKKDLDSFLESFYIYCTEECKTNEQIIISQFNDNHQNIYYSSKLLFETLFKRQTSNPKKLILPPLNCIVYNQNKKFFCSLRVQANEINDQQLKAQLSDLIQETPKLSFLQESICKAKDENSFWFLDIQYLKFCNRFSEESNLKELISDLDHMRVELNQISTVFHSRGIKMNQLGQVAQLSKNKFIKQICIIEMIARSFKHQNRQEEIKNYQKEVINILKNCFQNQQFRESFNLKIVVQFQYVIDDFITIPKILLLNSLMHHLNFQIDIRIKDLLESNVKIEECNNFYEYIIEDSLKMKSRGKYYFQSSVEQRDQKSLDYDIIQQQEIKFMESRQQIEADYTEKMIKLLYGESSIQLGQFQLKMSQLIDAGAMQRLHEALEIFENSLLPDQELIGLVFYQIQKNFEKEGDLQRQEMYFKKAVDSFKNDRDKDFIRFEYCKIANQNQHYQESYNALSDIRNPTQEMINLGFDLERKLNLVNKFTNRVFQQKLETFTGDFILDLSNSFQILKEKESIRIKQYLHKLEYCLKKFTTNSENFQSLIHCIQQEKITSPAALFQYFIQKFVYYGNILEFNVGLYRNFKTIIEQLEHGSEFWRILQLYYVIVRLSF